MLDRLGTAKILENCVMPGRRVTFLFVLWLSTVCCIGTSFAESRCPSPRLPLPVHFKADSAEFLPIGMEAAEELLQAILVHRPKEITLTGHADDTGDDEHNLRLSDKRARALARFLKRSGVTAKIVTVAKGKSNPHELMNTPEQYSAEEIEYLNRRVEWKLGNEPSALRSC